MLHHLLNLLTALSLLLAAAPAAAGADPPTPSRPWAVFATARLTDERTLRIERRVLESNERRVQYHYRFTVLGRDGGRETAVWTQATEFPYKPWKLRHAAWLDEGFLVLVLDEGHLGVWAWVVDMRPGEGRPDIHGQRAHQLTGISGIDGPGVRSVTVSGSVGEGSLTIRLFGNTPKGEGEVLRPALAEENKSYRWTVQRHDPPLPAKTQTPKRAEE